MFARRSGSEFRLAALE